MTMESQSPVAALTMTARILRASTVKLHGLAGRWVAPLGVFDAAQGFGEEAWIAATPETVLSVRLAGAHVTSAYAGFPIVTSAGGGQTALVVAGNANQFNCAGPVSFAQICLPSRLIDRAGSALGASRRLSAALPEDLLFPDDPDLDRLAADYTGAAARSATGLEMEARALLLLNHLLTTYCASGIAAKADAAIRGGLPGRALRRICERLTADLAAEPGLDELAALADLSPAHLCRAFRASTGLPPHRWLIERRVGRQGAAVEAGLVGAHRVH